MAILARRQHYGIGRLNRRPYKTWARPSMGTTMIGQSIVQFVLISVCSHFSSMEQPWRKSSYHRYR